MLASRGINARIYLEDERTTPYDRRGNLSVDFAAHPLRFRVAARKHHAQKFAPVRHVKVSQLQHFAARYHIRLTNSFKALYQSFWWPCDNEKRIKSCQGKGYFAKVSINLNTYWKILLFDHQNNNYVRISSNAV